MLEQATNCLGAVSPLSSALTAARACILANQLNGVPVPTVGRTGCAGTWAAWEPQQAEKLSPCINPVNAFAAGVSSASGGKACVGSSSSRCLTSRDSLLTKTDERRGVS